MAILHALISPVSYLHLIPQESKFHLLLAHLLHSEEYCDFYRKRKEQGDYIIIDNGAFELGVPLLPKDIYNLINHSGIVPDVVVAPDYPGEQWQKTVKSAYQFSQEFHNYFPKTTKLMVVPQSEKGDWQGWLACYKALSQIDHVEFIGMSILGVPKAFCSLTGTNDITYNRTIASLYLRNHADEYLTHGKKHHFLGCSDPRELLTMQMVGLAYSNDSSTAIWHGHVGVEFDNTAGGLKDGKTKIPVDFFTKPNPEAEKTIIHNIKWLQNLLAQ